jgi:hypothetical protein
MSQDNIRPILNEPVAASGLFATPNAGFTSEDEIQWAKRRMDASRVASYADWKCGLPNTFDPTGAYLCGGRKDGKSSQCNKANGTECLLKKGPLTNPHYQSCAFWETYNVGDAEARYSPHGRLEDDRIGFGETKNPGGFGCRNCEYARQMPIPDSEGRTMWCALKGMSVQDVGCCWDNNPIKQYQTDVTKVSTKPLIGFDKPYQE